MYENGSKSLQLSTWDWKKILTGLGIGMAGAALTWISTEVIPAMEGSDDATLLLLAAVLAAGANAARKWLMDTRQ